MIGVFDSGVGGLSVLTAIRAQLPAADVWYVADRARAPYGARTLADVEAISHDVSRWLIDRGADCLVVACNTASAAALKSIRREFPGVPVVGMEPAVKPAAATTSTGTVAVYATAATFQSELFESVLSRFAEGVRVLTRACPEWVAIVERGVIDGPEAEELVMAALQPAIDADADRIVLACTHFSFLTPVIERISRITVIDPAPAVAMQTARVAPTAVGSGLTKLAASGDTDEFAALARELSGLDIPVIRFET